MDAEFWHQRWQQQQTPFDQRQVNPLLSQYWPQLELEDAAHVFVPLCGKTVDMLWLESQGHSVVGAELSEIAVAEFFEQHRLSAVCSDQGELVCWQHGRLAVLCGDLFAIPDQYHGYFDALYDRAALVALPESMRDRYLEKLCQLLRPQGQMLLITLEHPDPDFQGPPFSVSEQEVRLRCEAYFQVQRLACETLERDSVGFSQRGLLGSTEVVYRLTRK